MAKPRVLISSDIGGADPDDIQSMVHAFLYADKVNLVGLVSTPSKHGGRTTHIHQAIDAYEKDYLKLKTWSSEYPTPQYLDSITKQGNINVAPSQGWSSATAGSQQIINAAKAASPSDPLWVLTWGSMTDLAQALHDDPSIKSNIKVYSIGAWNTQQDPAARNYIYNSHKDLWWIENNSTFRGMYVNDSGAASNSWKMGDAQGHGALGEHFYKAMPWGLKMGDTPSLLYLLDQANNLDPRAASWGGAFVQNGHGPNYWTDNPDPALRNGGYNGSETVQKFQSAFYQDFALRFDRAKAANTSSPTPTEPTPTPTPTPAPGDTSGGTGNPVVAGDDYYKTGVNQSHWFNTKYILMNDKGLDGGLTVSSMVTTSAAGGTVTRSSDGTVKYTPLKDWQGKDAINYTVMDKDGSKDTGTVYVQVGTGTTSPTPTPTPTEPAPLPGGTGNPVVAGDDYYKTGVNQSHWFNTKYILMNDKGLDGGLHVGSMVTKSAAGGTVSLASDGTVKYTPLKDWQGKDAINYTLLDKDGSADTGTVYIQVGTGTTSPTPIPTPTEPAPLPGGTGNPVVAADDYHKTTAGKAYYFNSKYLLWNDKAPDGGLKMAEMDTATVKGGSVSWDAGTGTAIYRAPAGFTGKDAVEYTATDVDGSKDTALVHFDVLLA